MTDGQSLMISPVSAGKRKAKFEAAVADTLGKYPRMLKRLAQ